MILFDSHSHLNDPAFDEDREDVIARMRAGGKNFFLLVFVNGRPVHACGGSGGRANRPGQDAPAKKRGGESND